MNDEKIEIGRELVRRAVQQCGDVCNAVATVDADLAEQLQEAFWPLMVDLSSEQGSLIAAVDQGDASLELCHQLTESVRALLARDGSEILMRAYDLAEADGELTNLKLYVGDVVSFYVEKHLGVISKPAMEQANVHTSSALATLAQVRNRMSALPIEIQGQILPLIAPIEERAVANPADLGRVVDDFAETFADALGSYLNDCAF